MYSRAEIVSKGFKIKPEDFNNMPVHRSRGPSQKRGEPNIDAKLAHFFRIRQEKLTSA